MILKREMIGKAFIVMIWSESAGIRSWTELGESTA